MLHSDCKRRIRDMLWGWEDKLDSLATTRPEHADKYRAEAEEVRALHDRADDVLFYGDQHAAELFLLEHVLPFILEGK